MFGPVADALVAARPDDPRAAELAEGLRSLAGDDPDALVRQALAAVRPFHEARWRELGEAERIERLSDAQELLGDAAALLDEAAVEQAAEEIARDTLRRELPMLTAATFWDLAEHP